MQSDNISLRAIVRARKALNTRSVSLKSSFLPIICQTMNQSPKYFRKRKKLVFINDLKNKNKNEVRSRTRNNQRQYSSHHSWKSKTQYHLNHRTKKKGRWSQWSKSQGTRRWQMMKQRLRKKIIVTKFSSRIPTRKANEASEMRWGSNRLKVHRLFSSGPL